MPFTPAGAAGGAAYDDDDDEGPPGEHCSSCCIMFDVLHSRAQQTMTTTRARQVGVAFPACCILADVWHSWVPRKMGIRPARSVACLLMLPVCPFAPCHWLKGRRSEACLCVVAPLPPPLASRCEAVSRPTCTQLNYCAGLEGAEGHAPGKGPALGGMASGMSGLGGMAGMGMAGAGMGGFGAGGGAAAAGFDDDRWV